LKTWSPFESRKIQRFHPPHHHWHLLDFSRYKFAREKTGRRVARSTKIIDTNRPFAGLSGSPAAPYYPAGSSHCNRNSIDGLSVGWADPTAGRCPGRSST
jgi:hypothetical protein